MESASPWLAIRSVTAAAGKAKAKTAAKVPRRQTGVEVLRFMVFS